MSLNGKKNSWVMQLQECRFNSQSECKFKAKNKVLKCVILKGCQKMCNHQVNVWAASLYLKVSMSVSLLPPLVCCWFGAQLQNIQRLRLWLTASCGCYVRVLFLCLWEFVPALSPRRRRQNKCQWRTFLQNHGYVNAFMQAVLKGGHKRLGEG